MTPVIAADPNVYDGLARVMAVGTGKCLEDEYPEGSILLNLGSGDIHWPGWVNIDSAEEAWNPQHSKRPDLVADITKLPYPDEHAEAVAAIHVIEHLYPWDVPAVLAEWKRVLKPSGRLILELPSMEKVFAYIASAIDRKMPMSGTFSFLPIWGDPKYRHPSMMHKWGYTFPSLRQELVKAGFVGVKGEKARYHFPNRDMRVTAYKKADSPQPNGEGQ